MRLIDADKVKQYALTEGFYCDTDADKEATAEAIDQLFPTVEAIPVDWLRERASRMLDFGEGVERIIKEWKDEQNK